ncbi:MAG: imidazole glycerol phosphate synthase subunit HisH [Planctomycetaceae bacterium]
MSAITIIDYGMGNLRSVQKALEKNGSPATITSDPRQIAAAEKLILPGVGAFRDAIAALTDHDLVAPIQDAIAADRPFLGICLGLQLLMDRSFEDGEFEGLGVVPGCVRKFELPSEFKIPHMGWNQLSSRSDDNPLLANLSPDAWFYFVHSYYVAPDDDSWTAARTSYGHDFVSVVRKGNVFATQFHPEKSQSAGLQLLKNFIEL